MLTDIDQSCGVGCWDVVPGEGSSRVTFTAPGALPLEQLPAIQVLNFHFSPFFVKVKIIF